jgi:hypothetical protein
MNASLEPAVAVSMRYVPTHPAQLPAPASRALQVTERRVFDPAGVKGVLAAYVKPISVLVYQRAVLALAFYVVYLPHPCIALTADQQAFLRYDGK